MKKLITLCLIMAFASSSIVFAATNNQKGNKTMKKITQTAGRTQLGNFAPEFAHFNDDILFGENWNNKDIDTKTRSIVTVVALVSQGITDSSLKYHPAKCKKSRCHKTRNCSYYNKYCILCRVAEGLGSF